MKLRHAEFYIEVDISIKNSLDKWCYPWGSEEPLGGGDMGVSYNKF